MPRTARNAKIDSRSSRIRLAIRREPFWTVISSGCAIGYRRGAKGGTWIARFRSEEGKQHYEALGSADDLRDADGLTVFSFAQAQERARKFFDVAARREAGNAGIITGPYSVAMAMNDYFEHRDRRGSKGIAADRYAAEARILPELGKLDIAKLTSSRIRDWHTSLASSDKLVRKKQGASAPAMRSVDMADSEAIRARRATANRVLTVLKASLNYAFHEGRISSDDAWRRVKPFQGTDTPKVRFLDMKECRRLINACQGKFRNLVQGALLTGCRYGELINMQISDFTDASGTILVRQSKSGKPRHVALNDEGRKFFQQLIIGKEQTALIFLRGDGNPWKASHQQRPLEQASERASIAPSVNFHTLRHTYASILAMKGVPMGVIAAQLGHADTRMTERHYAHLAPSYIADTIRAALPEIGAATETEIVPLRLVSSPT